MKVVILGVPHFVDFTYGEIERVESSHRKEGRFTGCIITEGEAFVGKGTAVLYYEDTYDKELGRQQALKKALVDSCFTKEQRTIVWDTYRNWGKKRF